jgi:hypothetical protein
MKRIIIKEGDIFIIPLDKKSNFNLEGEYIPDPKDKIGFGQYVYQGPSGRYIAIFKECISYADMTDEYIKSIYLKPILFLHESYTSLITQKRWLKLGNFDIQSQMPMQAYLNEYIIKGKTIYEAQDYKYNNPKSANIGNFKKINWLTAQKLHVYGRSCSPIILEEITQKYFKIIDYPYYNLNNYMPKKTGLVWKIFSEHYNNTWVENE